MARVSMNKLTKKCKGFGFASFATEKDAVALIQARPSVCPYNICINASYVCIDAPYLYVYV